MGGDSGGAPCLPLPGLGSRLQGSFLRAGKSPTRAALPPAFRAAVPGESLGAPGQAAPGLGGGFPRAAGPGDGNGDGGGGRDLCGGVVGEPRLPRSLAPWLARGSVAHGASCLEGTLLTYPGLSRRGMSGMGWGQASGLVTFEGSAMPVLLSL